MQQGHKVVFTTERSERHQRAALAAAPEHLNVHMLRSPDRETLMTELSDADYLISERSGVVDAALLRAATCLKLIQRLGSAAYDIDIETARAAGIAVCYWPQTSVVAVAEHVVMQMLAVAKGLNAAQHTAMHGQQLEKSPQRTDEDTFSYNWANLQTVNALAGKTIGIQGMGEIGLELARRLVPWDVQVLYHKRRPLPAPVERDLKVAYAEPDDLYAASDVLVNLLPYSQATDLLLNADVFALMPQGSHVVSAGSGSVIDEGALARALRDGQLAGAALDTYEYEPLQAGNPVLEAARDGFNVVLTPHIAAGSPHVAKDERADAYSNILAHLNGEPLRYQLA